MKTLIQRRLAERGVSVGRGVEDTMWIGRHESPLMNRYSDVVSGNTITLYRPVGQAEMDLIRMSGFREFPPRLPEQPFFYPVLNQEYATQIARDWNTKDERSGFAGFVLRFAVTSEFLRSYEVHIVGSSSHQEYWIPATDLLKMNANIIGKIEVLDEFHGDEQGA